MNRTLLLFLLAFISTISFAKPVCMYQSIRGDEYWMLGDAPSAYINNSKLMDFILSPKRDEEDEHNFLIKDSNDDDNWHMQEFTSFYANYKFDITDCTEEDNVLVDGSNVAGLMVESLLVGTATFLVDMKLSDGKKFTICRYHGRHENFECDGEFEIELQDANKDLYSELVAAQSVVEKLIADELELADDTTNKIIKVQTAIDAILDKSFETINDQDLADAEGALQLYKDLQADLVELDAERQALEEQLDDMWEKADSSIDLQLEQMGISEESFSQTPEIKLPKFGSIDSSGNKEERLAYYALLANETIDSLKELNSNNSNEEFILRAKLWIFHADLLRKQLAEQDMASPLEYTALTESFEKVENYIFTELDYDFWFRDSPVTQNQRIALDKIKTYDEMYGQLIEHGLRTWRDGSTTQTQENILQAMEVIAAGIDESNRAGEGGNYDSLLSGLAMAVVDGAVCGVKIVALGDFGDFYEILYGHDLCSGDILTMPERIVSAIGLFAGSAKFWRGAFRVVGLLPESKRIMNVVSSAKEYAKSVAKISDSELDGIASKMKKYSVCKK